MNVVTVPGGLLRFFGIGFFLLATCGQAQAEEDPLERAMQLDKEAFGLHKRGQHVKAIALAGEALTLTEKALGPDHPIVARSINNLAYLLQSSGDYETARPLHERALRIKEKALGPNHPEVASTLTNLSVLLEATGDYAAAKPLYERVLKIKEETLGPDHTEVANILHHLAELLTALGKYEEARPFCERALEIREKTLGPDHVNVARSLNNLAYLLHVTGDQDSARPLYERALEIYEKALGPDHPEVATSLSNLAVLLQASGDHGAARLHLEWVLKIREKAIGSDATEVAKTLVILAGLLRATGDYEMAKQHFDRALRVLEKALGPDHVHVATTLNNLGHTLHHSGDYEAAMHHHERALRIYEKTLGPEHPFVAVGLSNVASVLQSAGDYVAARPLFERALEIREGALGPSHPEVALSLLSLAGLLQHAGDYAAARPLCERALRIQEEALGPGHPDVATTLNNLAISFAFSGDYTAARPLTGRAERIVNEHLERTSAALSARQKLAMVLENRHNLDALVSVSIEVPSASEAATIWRWKGRVAEVLASERAAVLSSDVTALKTSFEKLASRRRELARLAFAPASLGDAAEVWQRMKELQTQVEQLEVGLARDSAALATQRRLRSVTLMQVQNAVPKDALLIDYLCYSHKTPNPKTHKVDMEDRYLAVWVAREAFGIVQLGPAEEIETAVILFREAVSQLDVPEERIRTTGLKLRKLVLDPVLGNLSMRPASLIVAPDAALHTVPFAALPGEERGSYLIQEYGISYASSGKDLVRWQQPGKANDSLLAVGDPDFTLTAARQPASSSRGEDVSACVNENWRDEITRLPGTRTEATQVQHLFSGNEKEGHLLLDKHAAESEVKRLMQSARFVHLATHGFFFSGVCAESGKVDTRGFGVRPRLMLAHDDGRLPLARVENPLLLSGLLLAGAAVAAPTGGDDGVLTAAEVMNLDLSGTELVTLSACDTGLGEVKSGEGVMGLRSAFLTAGARSLILSLWKVPDVQTQELMKDFYTMVFVNELDAPTSLRKAMLNAIASADPSRSHPAAWASFTCTGPLNE